MNPASIIEVLAEVGIRIETTATGNLSWSADRQPAEELLELIRKHQATLVEHLNSSTRPKSQLDIPRNVNQAEASGYQAPTARMNCSKCLGGKCRSVWKLLLRRWSKNCLNI